MCARRPSSARPSPQRDSNRHKNLYLSVDEPEVGDDVYEERLKRSCGDRGENTSSRTRPTADQRWGAVARPLSKEGEHTRRASNIGRPQTRRRLRGWEKPSQMGARGCGWGGGGAGMGGGWEVAGGRSGEGGGGGGARGLDGGGGGWLVGVGGRAGHYHPRPGGGGGVRAGGGASFPLHFFCLSFLLLFSFLDGWGAEGWDPARSGGGGWGAGGGGGGWVSGAGVGGGGGGGVGGGGGRGSRQHYLKRLDIQAHRSSATRPSRKIEGLEITIT